jgi:hypothetical protein
MKNLSTPDARSIRQYRRHTAVTPDGSHVIYMGRGLADIFTGVEWLQHSRYRYEDQRWKYVSGRNLPYSWIKSNLTSPYAKNQ